MQGPTSTRATIAGTWTPLVTTDSTTRETTITLKIGDQNYSIRHGETAALCKAFFGQQGIFVANPSQPPVSPQSPNAPQPLANAYQFPVVKLNTPLVKSDGSPTGKMRVELIVVIAEAAGIINPDLVQNDAVLAFAKMPTSPAGSPNAKLTDQDHPANMPLLQRGELLSADAKMLTSEGINASIKAKKPALAMFPLFIDPQTCLFLGVMFKHPAPSAEELDVLSRLNAANAAAPKSSLFARFKNSVVVYSEKAWNSAPVKYVRESWIVKRVVALFSAIYTKVLKPVCVAANNYVVKPVVSGVNNYVVQPTRNGFNKWVIAPVQAKLAAWRAPKPKTP